MRTGLSLLLALAGFALAVLHGPGDARLNAGLGILLAAAILWLSEALPVAVTALLIPLLAMITGLQGAQTAFAAFAHPIIFLFLGGYALAAALHQQGLDQWLAQLFLRLGGGRLLPASLLLFAATALLSMWISNTATTAMMLPLILGLADELGADDQAGRWFLLLGLAWSANIGGMGTLVGSPPNAIMAAQTGIGFSDWLAVGLPAAALLWPLGIGLLYWLFRPGHSGRVQNETATPLQWSGRHWLTAAVFLATVLAWVFSKPLGQSLGIDKGMDSWIAVLSLVCLHALGLLQWDTLKRRTDWGVLLLFGGGLALSGILKSSGASVWLTQSLLQPLAALPGWALLLGLVLFVVFLTELASNTATTALLLPLLLPLAPALELNPMLIAFAVSVSVSCAFMLPVATPPNAMVFGTGLLPQRVMMRAGLRMNLLAAVLLSLLLPVLVAYQ